MVLYFKRTFTKLPCKLMKCNLSQKILLSIGLLLLYFGKKFPNYFLVNFGLTNLKIIDCMTDNTMLKTNAV